MSKTRTTNTIYPPPQKRIAYRANREGVAKQFTDACASKSVEVDLELIGHYDEIITDLELYLTRKAKVHDQDLFHLLRSVPGIGKVLSMTILYEIHDIARFERVQEFASYSRLVKCEKSSAGKKYGKRKALSILAHRLGRAVYYMLKKKRTFSMEAFLTA